MNRLAIGAALIALALVVTGVGYSTSNDWAAVVNGHEIDDGDLLDELAQFRANPGLAEFAGLGEARDGSVPMQLASGWLGRLIQQQVIEEIATEEGVRSTQENRDEAEQLNIGQFGQEAWEQFAPWFRGRMLDRDALFIAVLDHLSPTPSEAELRAAYEANQEQFLMACASHILVATREEADALKAQLDGGADFAALATASSLDTASGQQGGDLGCQRRGSYVEPFESEVFTLPLDAVSEPIQTQFGFHLIRVASRDVAPFEEVRAELEQQVQGQSQDDVSRILLTRIEEADIRINPKYGDFEVTFEGPQVLPPVAPDPPDRLPVEGPVEMPVDPAPF